MRCTPSEQERAFREWMRSQVNEGGIRRYTDNAIIAYCYALRTACHKMVPSVAGNLFAISDADEFDKLYPLILGSADFEQVNMESGNGAFGVGMKLYRSYLKQENLTDADGLSAPFFLKKQINNAGYNENRGAEFNYNEVPMKPVQRIYYGAPGTGKSYSVMKLLEAEYQDKKQRDSHCKRVIFHPTYRYEDFVGSIKPLISLDKPLDYVYSPGPFTELLKEAFGHPTEKYYLIIEEINRGNAPAIFGDLFQLLDRQESGKSEYAVENVDVSAYFSRDPGLKNLFLEGKVWLPANYNIIATMNTADENIFVLDNAFKRRFKLQYVQIDFEEIPEKWSREYATFMGTESLENLFHDSPLEEYANRLALQGQLRRNWPTFARLVNYLIDRMNLELLRSGVPGVAKIPENKKLGPFFVSDEELMDRGEFINKVIFYLKQDVFSCSGNYMIESYEELYLKYKDRSQDLFQLLVPVE